MEELKKFEHEYNYWSTLEGADNEKPFDMEFMEAFDEHGNPLTCFNRQGGESRYEFWN